MRKWKVNARKACYLRISGFKDIKLGQLKRYLFLFVQSPFY